MHYLRLFGGLHLENAPDLITGRAAQRKRLALLALLSIGSRSVSRDRLIGLLWPESNEERGRPLLASALYDLRRVLGEDCILSAGDDLRLNPHRVTTDVWEFEEAIAVQDWARATSLYRGPLLEGLFVTGALDLERWIDDERRRFTRAWTDAVEKCAEGLEAAGDHRQAVTYWEKLALAEPLSARVAMRLVRSLAAAGERAAALTHARTYESRMRAEEMVPDPGVSELAVELTRNIPPRAPRVIERLALPSSPEQPLPPSPTRRTPVLLATAIGAVAVVGLGAMIASRDASVDLIAAGLMPDTPRIVIADHIKLNRVDDNSRAVTEWLRTDLAQSPYVRPLPLGRVAATLVRMEQDPKAPLDEERALEIARREGAAGVLAPEVRKLGDSYVVSAVLWAPDGREVFRTQEVARTHARLIDAVDALSANVRRAMGESRRSLRASPPLPRVTSKSIETLLLYRRGFDPRLNADDRTALLEQALRYDSTFAVAYRALALMANSRGQAVRSSYYARKAFEYSDRLPEPERSFSIAIYRDVALGERARAIDIVRALADRFPKLVQAHSLLADLLLREQRWLEAELVAPREIKLAPKAYAGHSNLMYAQLAQGKWREARRTLAAADSLTRDQYLFLALHYAEATRDLTDGARWLDSLAVEADADPFDVWSHRMDFALMQGQLRKAETIASTQLPMPAQRLNAAVIHARWRLRLLGDTAREIAAVETALRNHPLDSIPIIDRPYVPLIEFFADARQRSRAAEYLAQFGASPAFRPSSSAAAAQARGQGKFADAARIYDRLNYIDSSAECTYMYAFDLGFTHEQAGDVKKAIEAYEQGVNAFGCQYRDVGLGAAYLALYRLQRAAGNMVESARYRAALAELWSDADPELMRLLRNAAP